MSRMLVVLCDDWPIRAATAEQVTDQADPGHPMAVWTHRGIAATNPAARAAGVGQGLRRREAQRRCPDLVLIGNDEARDARHFEPVVAALGTLTPQVEVVEPGIAAFGTRGPSRYFGGDEALAERTRHLVSGVLADVSAVRVGVADGPLIAHLAARAASPDTPVVVPPGEGAAFVAPIPLASITGLIDSSGILDTFTQLGLPTLGAVATLPAPAVLGRFGSEGTWIHQLARGVDPTTSFATPIPDEVDEIIDFDPPETRADAVAFVVRSAADAFVDRLGRMGLSCAQVTITLSTDHAEELRRRWRLDGPGRSAEQQRAPATLISERVRWQADGWLSGSVETRPSAGITRVVIAPGEVRPARGSQLGFWGGASAAGERAARAVARLEALAGPDAVCVVEPRGGRHPAEDAALVPTATVDLGSRSSRAPHGPRSGLVPGRSSIQEQTRLDDGSGWTGQGPPWPGRLPAPSPATVLTTPRPVEVLDDAGTEVEVNGRGELLTAPATVRFSENGHPGRGRSAAITGWAGPWLVDERWWDVERRRRAARLQIVTAEGSALLVVRQDRRWWLAAVYT